MSDDASPVAALADLLVATGHAHHQAFIETDGADPEWPLWYAEHLQPRLSADHEIDLTVSALVHLLVQAEQDHGRTDNPGPWSDFYARRIAAAAD